MFGSTALFTQLKWLSSLLTFWFLGKAAPMYCGYSPEIGDNAV